MKLRLSLTLTGLLAWHARAGAVPAAPTAGQAAPAAVPTAVVQAPVSPVQVVAPHATAMNTLETGYNLFNLLAAPGLYDAFVKDEDQAAWAQAPQSQAAHAQVPQAPAADNKTPSQPQDRQAPPTQAQGRTQEKKRASAPSKSGADARSSPAAKK